MTTQLFSGMLRPYPGIPAEWPRAKRLLAESVLATARKAMPDHDFTLVPEADIENFWEDAFRLAASYLASGGDLEIATGKLGWTPDERARRLGPVSWNETGGRHSIDAFIAHPLVAKYGGRAMELVTYNSGEFHPENPDTIIDWIIARHCAGVERVVIKNAENKSGIWALTTSSDRSQVKASILKALDWTAIRLDGQEKALLAQDLIDLQYELRCFVVDGEVVTAAGNVEEFTPLDTISGGLLFDRVRLNTRLRQYRGHLTADGPSEVKDQTAVAIRLLKFAQQVAAEFSGTVVIDVALDATTDTPVIVELNELPNSGLFASDPLSVAERLMGARDRGYPQPAKPDALRTASMEAAGPFRSLRFSAV